MNDSGANSVLSSKVKLGADASVAAGPVGRDASAETDIVMKAEILSYSRARVSLRRSLEGSTMRSDEVPKVASTAGTSARADRSRRSREIPAAGLSLIHLSTKFLRITRNKAQAFPALTPPAPSGKTSIDDRTPPRPSARKKAQSSHSRCRRRRLFWLPCRSQRLPHLAISTPKSLC